jgi:hypothetical protein
VRCGAIQCSTCTRSEGERAPGGSIIALAIWPWQTQDPLTLPLYTGVQLHQLVAEPEHGVPVGLAQVVRQQVLELWPTTDLHQNDHSSHEQGLASSVDRRGRGRHFEHGVVSRVQSGEVQGQPEHGYL